MIMYTWLVVRIHAKYEGLRFPAVKKYAEIEGSQMMSVYSLIHRFKIYRSFSFVKRESKLAHSERLIGLIVVRDQLSRRRVRKFAIGDFKIITFLLRIIASAKDLL